MYGCRAYGAAWCCGTAAFALLLARVAIANSQPLAQPTFSDAKQIAHPAGTGVSLGAHTLLTQPNGLGTTPAMTRAMSTQPTGSALIVLRGGYAGSTDAPTDNYANAWKPVKSSLTFNGYGGSFDVSAYIAIPAKGGVDHRVVLVKKTHPEGEISVPLVEIKQAGVLQDVAQNYPAPALVVTSGNVTTTAPATLLAVWWGDAGVKRMTAMPNNGFAVIDSFLKLPDDSGVQCAVAFRQVAKAGTYNVSWTSAPVQGAILWLFAFQTK